MKFRLISLLKFVFLTQELISNSMVADFLDKKIFFREILEHKDEPK